MKHIKKFNEDLDNNDPILICQPYENRKSNRIEDGELVEAKAVHLYEMDMEGRYPAADYGWFKLNPEYFIQETREGHGDGKHYYIHKLSDAGWDWIEKDLKIKHPGRGWVSFTLLSESEVKRKIEEKQKSQRSTEMALTHLTNCLN